MGSHNFVRAMQGSLGSYTPDKLGALCLLTPFLVLRSFSTLFTLYHNPQSLFLTPAFTFLSFNLIALLIITTSIMSSPHKNKSIPHHVLQFPFIPIEMASFTSNESVLQETPKHRLLARSISCQNPSPQTSILRDHTLSRSRSHKTYLTVHSTSPPPLPTLEDLTDEEANKRFSAFIESRLATMKKEGFD